MLSWIEKQKVSRADELAPLAIWRQSGIIPDIHSSSLHPPRSTADFLDTRPQSYLKAISLKVLGQRGRDWFGAKGLVFTLPV